MEVPAYPFTMCPVCGTVAVLEVEHGRLCNVDTVGNDGNREAHDGTQDPALSPVEQDNQPAPKVLAGTQLLDAVGVGDTVVDPVCRRKLVVPHAVIRKDVGL